MGKAIAISIAMVLIVFIIAYFVRRSVKDANQVGDLTLDQERVLRRLVDDAAMIMRSLGYTYDVDDSDLLSERSKRSVSAWLDRYHNNRQKEINA